MIFSYIRTSVWKENKVTMEMQQEAIHAKLDALGLPRPEPQNVFEDRGISGAKYEERPGLQRLLVELRQPSAAHSTLVVYRFDRLSRNSGIMITILDVLEKNDIELISVMEPLPANNNAAFQKMMIHIHGTIAQFERDMLIENVKMGFEQKRREAKPLSVNVPFGYRYKSDGLESVEAELKIVRLVYELYLTGKFGYRKICRRLNQAGHKFKNRDFAELDIYRILSNKTYYGLLKGGTVGGAYKGTHETAITEAEFKSVQQIRKKHHVTKKSRRVNWLRGKVACPLCGQNLSPRAIRHGRRVYDYYHCAKPGCKEQMVSANQIEQKTKKAIMQFIVKNPYLDLMLDEIQRMQKNNLKQQKMDERQYKRTKEKLFLDFENGRISADEFTESLMKLDESGNSPPNIVRATIKKEQLESLLEQRAKVKEERLPDGFYFNLVDRVYLGASYQLKEIYLNSLAFNILEQEEIVL